MKENCVIYKTYKEVNGKKYVNFHILVNGFKVVIEPKFLSKKAYKCLLARVPNEAK